WHGADAAAHYLVAVSLEYEHAHARRGRKLQRYGATASARAEHYAHVPDYEWEVPHYGRGSAESDRRERQAEQCAVREAHESQVGYCRSSGTKATALWRFFTPRSLTVAPLCPVHVQLWRTPPFSIVVYTRQRGATVRERGVLNC